MSARTAQLELEGLLPRWRTLIAGKLVLAVGSCLHGHLYWEACASSQYGDWVLRERDSMWKSPVSRSSGPETGTETPLLYSVCQNIKTPDIRESDTA